MDQVHVMAAQAQNQTQAAPAPAPAQPQPQAQNQTQMIENAPIGTTPYTLTASHVQEMQTAPQNAADSLTGLNSNDALLAQLQQQNETLMQQNQALINQVSSFINQGIQLNGNQTQQQQQPQTPKMTPPQVQQMLQMGMQPDPLGQINTPSLSNMQDFSLEGLASEIGKD